MMQPEMSIVIPAYNEGDRLPPYLEMIRVYLDQTCLNRHEVIIVDDGSSDLLADLVSHQARDWPQLSLIRHDSNRGKGSAVQTGLRAARGNLILVADADGATPIHEELSLRMAINAGAHIAIGSRGIAQGKPCDRTWWRWFSGLLFAWVVRAYLHLPLKDTQCGFKMFRRDVAQTLLTVCQEPGYLLDVEILMWAHRFGYRIAEVPVAWRDVPDSKVCVLSDGHRMVRGLFALRRRMRAASRVQNGTMAHVQFAGPLQPTPLANRGGCTNE